jgi:CRP-like cAMP-binding protein
MRCDGAANRLIVNLPSKDRKRLLERCDEVRLHFADVISNPGERFRHVYFPESGLVSLLLPISGRANFEVDLIGDEGMLGASVALGVDISPLLASVQGPGIALRMSAAAFRGALGVSPSLRRTIGRYIYIRMAQLAQGAACTRFHLLDARLARWLLMTHDRAHGDEFHLTHELLAGMLGVRRVGITNAAGSLQKRRLVRYTRGTITILDRPGLEAAACECYQATRSTYEHFLGVRSDDPARPR